MTARPFLSFEKNLKGYLNAFLYTNFFIMLRQEYSHFITNEK